MVSQNAVIAAFSSTALISLAPNVLLFLFPHFASGEGQNSPILSLGQCLAAGGLLGDVFLHVIPHSAGGNNVGMWILLGFSIFLIVDMIMRSISSSHDHQQGHQHQVEANKGKNNNNEHSTPGESNKSSTILLNLAADSLHNFTDGIAIGASFSGYSGNANNDSILNLLKSRGGLATLSILFHEIPHELGDFAILVKHGFSKKQAILAQFGTAVAAMIGTVVGLMAADMAGESLVLVTAGGFVYLATVTILPDILNDDGCSLQFRLAQILSFALGVAFLYAVSLLEEMESHSGHGHSHQHHDHGHSQHNHGHYHGEL